MMELSNETTATRGRYNTADAGANDTASGMPRDSDRFPQPSFSAILTR
jgi:hypothetical protein